VRCVPDFFEGIRAKAKSRWDQLESDPDLAGPWWQLFRQVQSPRHVLSELLQNADDAGATWASASLKDGFFVFEHNGHDFTRDEFESLCSFGRSNKRKLLTIGFRGIGFKSVFSLGPAAELLTPAIACRFHKERFTEPETLTEADSSDYTTVRVRLDAPEKENLIEEEFERWRKSPLPLLFFENIKGLSLEGMGFTITSSEHGPCVGSEYVKLTGMADKVIVFRSEEENFPPDCVREIYDERGECDVELAPCRVIVVANVPDSDKGRLHVVLPTGVKLNIPVCAQAPFIQDPARSGIKEPASSPVNRWLLERIGHLLGSNLLSWLGRSDQSLPDRANAYSLMPPKGTDYSFNVEQSAANYVSKAFADEIQGRDVLLTANGELGNKDSASVLPRQVINAWGWEVACEHFAPNKKYAVAPHIRQQYIENLSKWGLVEIIRPEDIFTRIQDKRYKPPPRPTTLENLLPLWSLAERTIETMTGMWHFWRRAAIVPVEGSDILGRAEAIISLPSAPEKCSEADWQFLCSMVELLDSGWSLLMSEVTKSDEEFLSRLSEAAGMRIDKSDLTRIRNAYDKTGLNRQCELTDILNLAATSIFSNDDLMKEDAIRLVHVVARLDLPLKCVDTSLPKFLCQDGQWRIAEDCLVPGGIDIASLIPSNVAQYHVVSDDYEVGLEPKDKDIWRRWAKSPSRGGIQQFPLPGKLHEHLWSKSDLREFCRGRGGKDPSTYYERPNYSVVDWDFPKEFWNHWENLEAKEPTVWLSVVWAILNSWSKAWEIRKNVSVSENWGDYYRNVDTGGARAVWLHRLRLLKCLPDEFNHPRMPSELYSRNPETSALLGIEPFVNASWDLASYRAGLEALGIRSDPADIQPLLKRLEDLSQAQDPPIGPLRDLYHAIDRVAGRLPMEQIVTIKNIFGSKKIARAEDTWERIDAVFRTNPSNLPGVAVLHHDITDIPLWERLGVNIEPGFDDALSWLDALLLDSFLSERDYRDVIKLLARYPRDIWNKSNRWINLEGKVIHKFNLSWGCCDSDIAEGLFSGIRSSVADFSMVDRSAFLSIREALPPMLEDHLRMKISQVELNSQIELSEQVWLKTLGTLLACLRIPKGANADDFVIDRKMGQRLATTKLNFASSLHIQKHLNGSPVSLEREETVAWYDNTLYIVGDIAGIFDKLIKELIRPFRTEVSKQAIRDCVARSALWIESYGQQHLELDDVELSKDGYVPQEPEGTDGHGDITIPPNDDDMISSDTGTDIDGKKEDSEGEEEGILRKKRQAGQFKRLNRFLSERGYQWNESRGAFLHSNGAQIIRTQGAFHWKLVSAGQEHPFFIANSSFDSYDGVEIPAEAWEFGKKVNATILEPQGDSYVEHTFSDLVSLVEKGRVNIYPAVIRLKTNTPPN